MATASPAHISTIASFPPHFFLENLAARADGSILVTVLNHKQLWYVPVPETGQSVTPALVHTFDHIAMGIVETEPDIFYVSTAVQTTGRAHRMSTIGPQLQTSPVISGDELSLLEPVFALPRWGVRTVQS